ncbi:hypothetical protein [Streptomyces sp. MJP52]|uniref:hypothetical protein n=1 Tax=Streptomyces sp. MJP52 TaxID=2940555 RepID=UPI002473B523|nr:hypothetical protein [Streptomyces sp. MJP52]MDH6228972.1 hypothetical protein [Streptomyces sp. MJP52]
MPSPATASSRRSTSNRSDRFPARPRTATHPEVTEVYGTFHPVTVHVQAAGPIAALRDAFTAAIEQTRDVVREFQTPQSAEGVLEEAMEVFHHVAMFEGTHRPVDFRELYG